MNNFFQSIIDFFKNMFGIETVDKPNEQLYSDYDDTNGMSVTAAMSNNLSTLTLTDAEINVVGDSARAKYLSNVMESYVNTRLKSAVNVCLGTGDCIIKPNTDGKRFGVDIVENGNFIIVDYVGGFLYSVLIKCDEIKKDNTVFERWELHKLNEYEGTSYTTITQVAFKDGKNVPIATIDVWANLKENQIVPNVDRLLFGRYKCPTINRYDVNSPNGVPITSGAEEIVIAAKTAWRRFNKEFEDKETMIFADKRVFKAEKVKLKDGTTIERNVLPKGKDRVIMNVNGSNSVDDKPLIQEYSPDIRDTSLDNAIERNFRMLELFCGFSEGLLSKSTLTYTNVDEVRKSTQQTYAFITMLRKVIKQGTDDLLYAINIICNANNITPMGNYDTTYDFSDSYVESMAERYNQLLQALNMDTISKAEFRAWVMNEDIDIAEEMLSKMQQQNMSLLED